LLAGLIAAPLLLVAPGRAAWGAAEQVIWRGWGLNENWSNTSNWDWDDFPDKLYEMAVFKKDATAALNGVFVFDSIQLGWDQKDWGIDVTILGQTDGSNPYADIRALIVPDEAVAQTDKCTFLLTRHGVINCDIAKIGGGSIGYVTIDGSGSALIAKTLVISPVTDTYERDLCHGVVYVKNGATLETDEAQVGVSKTRRIVGQPEPRDTVPAKVEISGSGSQWIVKRLLIPARTNAQGEVWIKGGTVRVENQFSLGDYSTLHLAGGTLQVSTSFNKPDGTLDFTSGTLDLRFGVTASPSGPLGSAIYLGAGKTLKANTLSLPPGGALHLTGGKIETGDLSTYGGVFSDTAESTTSVDTLSGFTSLHLLGAMKLGGDHFGDLTVSDSGGVHTLTVDKPLTVNYGKLSLRSGGVLTVGDVLKLATANCTLEVHGGSKLAVKTLDDSAGGTLNLQGGEITIDGGTLKAPSSTPFVVDAYSPVSLIFKNGGSASFPIDLTVGKEQGVSQPTSTVTQTDGVVNVARSLTLGFLKDASRYIEGNGTYNLAGTGQLNANYNYQDVGYAGKGTFNLNGGTNRASKYLQIGVAPTGRGTYNVNSGTLSVADGLYVGGNYSMSGGTGTLNIAGGNTTVTNTLKLWNQGTLNLSGGNLSTGELDRRVGTFNWTSGLLTFTKELLVAPDAPFGSAITLGGNQTIAATAGVKVAGGGSLVAGSGGKMDASGKIINVGYGGQGTLAVPDGGTVLSGGSSSSLGYDAPGNGAVTVSGTGKWTNSGGLAVGR
jgi:hypothetical protein